MHVCDGGIPVGQQTLLMDTAQDTSGSEKSNDLGLDGEPPSCAFRCCSIAINNPNQQNLPRNQQGSLTRAHRSLWVTRALHGL